MTFSIHIIGSRQFGGADHFYVRLVSALSDADQKVLADGVAPHRGRLVVVQIVAAITATVFAWKVDK